ncbi:MAG: hypothetical protein ACYSUD_07250 [Planctomycetota bacterium]|jgi:hypothetical protein
MTKFNYSPKSGQSPQDVLEGFRKTQACEKSGLHPVCNKRSRWKRPIAAIIHHLKNATHLIEAWARATAEKEHYEAQKIAEEAAEIAARRSLLRQKEVEAFATIIDDIFTPDALPPAAKVLKLAKLMENNPQIVGQMEKAREVLAKVCPEKLTDESHESLPANTVKSKRQT